MTYNLGQHTGCTLTPGRDTGFCAPQRPMGDPFGTRPENRAGSSAALASNETATLGMSRVSTMGPPPRHRRVTDND